MSTRPGRRVLHEITGESLTKQSMKQDCDVNFIVKNHAQTGMWAHLNPRQPTYGNFDHATDLQTSIDMVDSAQADFDELPAEVRSACNNDPVQLLEALATEEGTQRLVDRGLPLAEEPEVGLSEQIATGVAAGLATPENPQGADPAPEGKD